ncbi:Hsp20 family protein [Pseudomaricurvus alcaniphilus]|uniref:Hsp20/alpha crystallin family protein n=1 Tax=Pseudomaricurvus alcaniphilus TaxID=1166482 RepID=UPI0014082878|nr:Hsp20/alpha crystallin family protein [Pseudomaricurvus alcaniphilus]NHN38413.1 Hsp20 family protein [Pseudomaricurvus alcaniphilus]
MNLKKLNPWNWFKHEDRAVEQSAQIPVRREEATRAMPSLWQGDQLPVQQLHQQFDRLFEDVCNAFGMPSLGASVARQPWSGTGLVGSYRPQIDVSGDDRQYEITLDVPGLGEDDLSIEVKGDVLMINGQKEEKNEHKDKHFYRVERSYGAFQRTLSLPADANADAIKANLKDGVLTLQIPRFEGEQEEVRRIAISSR